MNLKEINKQWIFLTLTMGLLLSFMFVLASYTSVIASNEDSVEGEFSSTGYNNPILVNSFELTETTTTAVTQAGLVDGNGDFLFTQAAITNQIESGAYLVPQNEYQVAFELEDRDTLEDLYQVELVFYYNESGAGITDNQAFDNTINSPYSGSKETPNDGTFVVFKWVHDGTGDFEFEDSDGSSSWEVIQTTAPAIMNNTTFIFELAFKISRAAPISNDGEWQFGIRVIDSKEATGTEEENHFKQIGLSASDPVNTSSRFNMNFYGEVTFNDDSLLNWGTITQGTDFSSSTQANTGVVTFFANAPYETQVASDSIWQATQAAVVAEDAVLVTNPAVATSVSAQAFGLRINEASITDGYQTTGSDPAKTLANGFIILDTFSTPSSETGTSESYAIYLAVSTNFQNATYQGSIIFSVNNTVQMNDPFSSGGE